MAKDVINNSENTVDVDGVEFTPCSGWTLRLTRKLSAYVANDTENGTRRTAGAQDATGTIIWRPNKASGPPFNEGDRVLLRLRLTNDLGDGYYEGFARIAEFNVDTTPQDDGGDSQKVPITWEGDGLWDAFNLVAEDGSSSA